MKILRDKTFLAIASGHFAVDLLNGQRALLLAALSGPLGLTNALIGALSTGYTVLGAGLQPLFGWLADRIGSRWVASVGILWMALTFALAVLVPGPVALVPLVLTAVGSGAFHPAGTMEATHRGRFHFAGQAAFAASLFFLFGQVGLSLGPALGGLVLQSYDLAGLTVMLALVVPVGINAGVRIPQAALSARDPETSSAPPGVRGRLLPFGALLALRSWPQMAMIAFLPKYYSDLGFGPAQYGLMAALFMGGSALGGVVGGWLGDRVDKRRFISWSLLAAVVPMALMPGLGATDWRFLLVPLTGALSGASHSLLVVLAQAMLPRYVGAASGMVLGFTFASGSIGALVSGFLADRFGFSIVFQLASATLLLAGLLALGNVWQPRKRLGLSEA